MFLYIKFTTKIIKNQKGERLILNLDLFEKLTKDLSENKEIQEFMKEIQENLENITDKISNKLLNRDYEQAEKTLQQYFEGEGERRYKELLEGDFDDRAYYVLDTEKNNTKVFLGSNTTEDISNPIKIECFNDIKYPVAFRIEEGKVAVDEELSKKYEEMENKIEKGLNNRNNTMLLESIENENATSLKSSLKMIEARNEIIAQYAQNTLDEGDLYYILYKSNVEGNYQVLKYEGEDWKKFGVLEMDLPDGAGVNTVMRLKDNKYVIDEKATETITSEITENAFKILKEQSNYLQNCRIEGNLYCITEDVYDRIYLTNLNTNEKFEEVDFPKELFKEANLGNVVKFENGTYEIVTKSKYQQDFEVKANNQLGNEKQDGTLYCVSEEEYYIGLINLNNGEEFEALDFPEELKDKITEGAILIYEKGEYRLK